MTYEKIMETLFFQDPIHFSRWGDGEWNCILGKHGENCDGHKYYSDLGVRLGDVLTSNPEYFLGLQSFAIEKNGFEINDWIQAHGLENRAWSDADIFHNASIDGELQEIFRMIKENRVVLVAQDVVVRNLHPANFISVPRFNCWLQYESILKQCMEFVDRSRSPNPVVLLCCGMMANVIVDELYIHAPWCSAIDLGSVLDPYVGLVSRRYHQQIVNREKGKQ